MNQAILNKQRHDKFIMVLSIPPIMRDIIDVVSDDKFDPDSLQFSCYGSPVPNVSIPSIDVPYGGQVIKISSNSRPVFPSFVLTFVIDNGWRNYWILLSWLNLFNDQKDGSTSYNHGNRSESEPYAADKNNIPFRDMVSSFKTYAIDEYNKKIMGFDFTNVFPTEISEIGFSHQDPSEIICKASFAFNQLHPKLIRDIDKNNC